MSHDPLRGPHWGMPRIEAWGAGVTGSPLLLADSSQTYVVGRSASADLRVEASGLDRRHLTIALREHGWTLVGGLCTTAGTWLNDRLVVEDQVLRHGDRLQLGDAAHLLVYFRDEGRPPVPPPGTLPWSVRISPAQCIEHRLAPLTIEMDLAGQGWMVCPFADQETYLRLAGPPGGPLGFAIRAFDLPASESDAVTTALLGRARQRLGAMAGGVRVGLPSRVCFAGWSGMALPLVAGESLGREQRLVALVSPPIDSSPRLELEWVGSGVGLDSPEPLLLLTHPPLAHLAAGMRIALPE